ncbi:MAG: site-specific integrase [Pseudomonas putida]|jgi:integrase|nr:site-specific integrase [Pseudomonas putida]
MKFKAPFPLFDTYREFKTLDFSNMSKERDVIKDFLSDIACSSTPEYSYLAVRRFLHSYDKNEATFNSYRTHVERLLLWCLLISEKSIVSISICDAESFMDFCLDPPKNWVGPVVKARFIRVGGRKKSADDVYVLNEKWRPFSITQSKSVSKISIEADVEPPRPSKYIITSASVGQIFAVCESFYEFLYREGSVFANPFRGIQDRSRYTERGVSSVNSRVLTPTQWEYVITTAEDMARENSAHERTLFILVTLFSFYLRVSDLIASSKFQNNLEPFLQDGKDWWFHGVRGSGSPFKIKAKPEYIEYLKRYRVSLSLSPLPRPEERTPLLSAVFGRDGLSDRHIRQLIQQVFDRAVDVMNRDLHAESEISNLRLASLHWLRHTSASFDAPLRDAHDLQADLDHKSSRTTRDDYYT